MYILDICKNRWFKGEMIVIRKCPICGCEYPDEDFIGDICSGYASIMSM